MLSNFPALINLDGERLQRTENYAAKIQQVKHACFPAFSQCLHDLIAVYCVLCQLSDEFNLRGTSASMKRQTSAGNDRKSTANSTTSTNIEPSRNWLANATTAQTNSLLLASNKSNEEICSTFLRSVNPRFEAVKSECLCSARCDLDFMIDCTC